MQKQITSVIFFLNHSLCIKQEREEQGEKVRE